MRDGFQDVRIFNQVERAGFELAIRAEGESRKAVVRIDADCFAQIIINLVDNAIKFSRNSGARKIDIGATVGSDGTCPRAGPSCSRVLHQIVSKTSTNSAPPAASQRISHMPWP